MSIIGLLLVGLITYWIVQRNVAGITRTPVWLLWLVMMTPATTWVIWELVHGNKPIPPELVIFPLLICLLLYVYLVQRGRIDIKAAKKPMVAKSDNSADSPTAQKPAINPEIVLQTEQPGKPSSNQPELPAGKISARLLTDDEEAALKSCFPWSVYYLQTIIYRLQAAICKGQLRTDSSRAYETVRQNVAETFGDRFLVIFQEGLDDKPFFAIVPNPQLQRTRLVTAASLYRPRLALALLVATLVTTTLTGGVITGTQPQPAIGDPDLWLQGLWYSVPLLVILGTHELAHYLTARVYKVLVTLPYFIPAPFFLGTLGAFIQTRSPMPSRKALFDISIAGPMAGFVATIPILLWGLAHSEVVPLPENGSLSNLQALNPAYTIVLALLSKLALGSALTDGMGLKLHPMAIAGCLGLVVTALNLMPVGQLDGGHIVHAMVGQRKGAIIGQITRILMLLLCLRLPDFWLWALLLFLMPSTDEPALNDVTELDNQRDLWGLVAIAILLLIILPTPTALTRLLFPA